MHQPLPFKEFRSLSCCDDQDSEWSQTFAWLKVKQMSSLMQLNPCQRPHSVCFSLAALLAGVCRVGAMKCAPLAETWWGGSMSPTEGTPPGLKVTFRSAGISVVFILFYFLNPHFNISFMFGLLAFKPIWSVFCVRNGCSKAMRDLSIRMSSNTFSYFYFMVVLFGRGWGFFSFFIICFVHATCTLMVFVYRLFHFFFCICFPLLARIIKSVHFNFDLLTWPSYKWWSHIPSAVPCLHKIVKH